MPPRNWRLRIEDYIRGMTFEVFSEDKKTVDAVVRNLEVIGEAAQHVPDEVRKRFGCIAWADMSDMRNVLIHEHFGVDLPILFRTIRSDLPPLVPASGALQAPPELNRALQHEVGRHQRACPRDL